MPRMMVSRHAVRLSFAALIPVLVALCGLRNVRSQDTDIPFRDSILQTVIYGVNAIVDIRRHCVVQSQNLRSNATNIRLGAIFNNHEQFSSITDVCSAFSGWAAVQQSQAYFHFLSVAEQLFPNPSQRQVGLGSMAVDSCSSDLLGVNVAQAIGIEGILFRNRTFQTLRNAGPGVCVNDAEQVIFATPPMVGLVGPMTSFDVSAVSSMLSALEMLHVSHWATSSLLDQTDRFPFLFRSVPSDKYQAAAIADILEHFQWRYVTLLAGDDEFYSGQGFELLRAEALQRGTFCLSIATRFSVSTEAGRTGLRTTLELVRRDDRARVVIVFATAPEAQVFFSEYQQANITGKIVIGSDDWVNRLQFNDTAIPSLQDSPILGLAPRTVVSSHVLQLVNSLRSLLRSPVYLRQASLQNPWLRVYIEDQLGCSLGPGQQCSSQLSGLSGSTAPLCTDNRLLQLPVPSSMVIAESVFLGMLSLATVSQTLLARCTAAQDPTTSIIRCLPEIEEIRRTMTELTLPRESPTGQCRVFLNESQSVQPAYTVLNLQQTAGGGRDLVAVGTWDLAERITWSNTSTLDIQPYGTFNLSASAYSVDGRNLSLPVSTCSSPCQPGQRRSFGDMLINAACCWSCQTCTSGTFSNVTNADTCHECGQGFRSSGTFCIALETLQVSVGSVEYLVILVSAILGLLASSLTMIVYHRYRTAGLVHASDLTLSTVALVAMSVGHVCAPFVIIVGSVTTSKCTVFTILPEPIKVLVVASILAKTNRLNTIFKMQLRLKEGLRFLLGTPMQIIFIFLLAAIDVIILILYELIDPSKAETSFTNDQIEVTCSINVAFSAVLSAYHCLLLMICIILAFLTRKLPEDYNQSQLLYIASLTAFVVWLGLAPAFFISGGVLRPFISSLFLEAELWAVWVCLYLPRVYQMLRHEKYRRPHTRGRPVLDVTGSDTPKAIQGGMQSLGSTQSTGFVLSNKHPTSVSSATDTVNGK